MALSQIGPLFRKIRISRGLTQEQVAGWADISRPQLVNIELGRSQASLSALFRVAQALGLRINVSLVDDNGREADLDPAVDLRLYRRQIGTSQRNLKNLQNLLDKLQQDFDR